MTYYERVINSFDWCEPFIETLVIVKYKTHCASIEPAFSFAN